MDYEARTDTLELPAGITRLVALGDPHGDLLALDEVLNRERRPDTALVSVGDNVGYADAGSSSHLCAVLQKLGIPSVHGNHEAWVEDGRLSHSAPGLPTQLTPEATEWLATLPFRLHVQAQAAPEVSIGVVHSFADWTYVRAASVERLSNIEGVQVTFCGHTHRPAIWILERGQDPKVRRLNPRSKKGLEIPFDPRKRYVVDAGSLARPSFGGGGFSQARGTYAVFDMDAGTLALHSVDLTQRIQELLRKMTRGPESDAS